MRCNNCGWENAGQSSQCEKCFEVLGGGASNKGSSTPPPPPQRRPPPPPPVSRPNNPIKGTIRGAAPSQPFIDAPGMPIKNNNNMKDCPNCQAPVRAEFSNCPYCQFPINKPAETAKPVTPPKPKPKSKPVAGTILNYGGTGESFAFALRKVDRHGQAKGEKKEFSENNVKLNRDNLEPGNNSITSKVQASITNEGGKWYLSNESQMESTFIQLKKGDKFELKDGTVVLFGSSGFIFETK